MQSEARSKFYVVNTPAQGGGRDPVVKLGRSLYWDERLSANGKVAFAEFIRELPSHEKTLFLNQRLCLPALDNPKLLTFPPLIARPVGLRFARDIEHHASSNPTMTCLAMRGYRVTKKAMNSSRK